MVDFKASVGMTELWDARKAGREVAKKTMSGEKIHISVKVI